MLILSYWSNEMWVQVYLAFEVVIDSYLNCLRFSR